MAAVQGVAHVVSSRVRTHAGIGRAHGSAERGGTGGERLTGDLDFDAGLVVQAR
jgi:hypothetical protein